jgi:hypothetical protein
LDTAREAAVAVEVVAAAKLGGAMDAAVAAEHEAAVEAAELGAVREVAVAARCSGGGRRHHQSWSGWEAVAAAKHGGALDAAVAV